jgi:hypothetical protein
MSRKIEFKEDNLVIHLTGLTVIAALKHNVEIPYSAIKNVTIETFDISLLTFRIGTSGFGVREGRFMVGSDWYFLTYENHENVVVLDLEDHEYKKVVFQIENPEETKQLIISKCTTLI